MRSRIIIKCNFWLEVFAEKIMEWLEFLRYKARNRKEYSSSEEEIGKVALYRKKKLIQEAKLIIKKGAKEYEKLIYWKFD